MSSSSGQDIANEPERASTEVHSPTVRLSGSLTEANADLLSRISGRSSSVAFPHQAHSSGSSDLLSSEDGLFSQQRNSAYLAHTTDKNAFANLEADSSRVHSKEQDIVDSETATKKEIRKNTESENEADMQSQRLSTPLKSISTGLKDDEISASARQNERRYHETDKSSRTSATTAAKFTTANISVESPHSDRMTSTAKLTPVREARSDKDLYKLRSQYLKRLKAEKAAILALESAISAQREIQRDNEQPRKRKKSAEIFAGVQEHSDLIDVLTSAVENELQHHMASEASSNTAIASGGSITGHTGTEYKSKPKGTLSRANSLSDEVRSEADNDIDIISAAPLPYTTAQNAFFSHVAFTSITDSFQKQTKTKSTIMTRRIRGNCEFLKFDVKIFVNAAELNVCELRANYSAWAKGEISKTIQKICAENHIVNLFFGLSEYAKLAQRRAVLFSALYSQFAHSDTKLERANAAGNQRIEKVKIRAFLGVNTLSIEQGNCGVLITWKLKLEPLFGEVSSQICVEDVKETYSKIETSTAASLLLREKGIEAGIKTILESYFHT